MPRCFSSGARSISSNAVNTVPEFFSDSTFVMAAVSVVLPWSMCPIVPTLTCGLVRSNFCLPMSKNFSWIGGGTSPAAVVRPPPGGSGRCSRGPRRYAPVALAMISFAIPSGTSAYEWNCIVYVARPWVRLRRSVA